MKKILLSLSLLSSFTFGDVIINPPFVRAKGMAEAFTSIGGDGSAIYYNPATLVNLGLEKDMGFFSFSIGNRDYIDAKEGGIKEGSKAVFFGLGASRKTIGFSLAFYSLSEITYMCNANAQYSYCKQYTSVFQIGAGFELFSIERTGTALSIGLSGFSLVSRYDEYYDEDNDGEYELINEEVDLKSNIGGSFGVYVRLFESERLALDMGASYRTKLDVYEETYYGEKKQTFFDMPPALFYGVSAKILLPFAYLIVSYDEHETYYSEMDYKILGDSKRKSLGLEIAFERFAIRGGMFKEDFENTLLDSKGYTFGFSIRISKFIFSGAWEFRKTDLGEDSFNTTSYYGSLDLQF
ncbi:MAG: hypothetical protein DSY42_02630 [Aquifex sp.]|nr:MAG: hypothetical protein DSY42_02630 [Aquifex sp.]